MQKGVHAMSKIEVRRKPIVIGVMGGHEAPPEILEEERAVLDLDLDESVATAALDPRRAPLGPRGFQDEVPASRAPDFHDSCVGH